ncbi:Gfo/Idh/MocA family oxidoreductase [Bacillus atrophaeus]|uniref:Gfo/Idh/MocA family protein n=1 Tax=Bacillus atrophaeus TaxID=1452 RepID=UPI0028F6CB6C|nr:Gfo/Idh/MocA family oxidoreductase [Bacillus atrophaeus]WNV78905.1 Gfo/Idh/MocA family oxidoreductase [Bacillus atrophaeus]
MIRFAIVGTNWITERFLQSASDIQDFQLTAVYSRSVERAAEFAKTHGAGHSFSNLQDMAASDCFDAVYIASPNAYHKEQAILFMNHGKHVLCEKPLASNAKDAADMISAAKANEVVLMEAMKTTFLPNFVNIQNHIHKIGEVRRFTASYCQYSSRYDAFRNGTVLNAFKPELSNGSLMDIGVYCIYPAVVLFGEPKEVKASGYLLSSGVDGEGTVILSYDGLEAVLMHSKIATSYTPAEIQGEDGTIILDTVHRPEKVEIRYRDGRVEDISVADDKPAMFYEAAEFITLIKERQLESAGNTFDRSLMTLNIMDEARKQIGVVFPADH